MASCSDASQHQPALICPEGQLHLSTVGLGHLPRARVNPPRILGAQSILARALTSGKGRLRGGSRGPCWSRLPYPFDAAGSRQPVPPETDGGWFYILGGLSLPPGKLLSHLLWLQAVVCAGKENSS